jgi:hypothetical protein
MEVPALSRRPCYLRMQARDTFWPWCSGDCDLHWCGLGEFVTHFSHPVLSEALRGSRAEKREAQRWKLLPQSAMENDRARP